MDQTICTALEKTVHFGTNTIVHEIKSKGECTKDVQCTKEVQLFSLVLQLFNGCTAFQKYTYEDPRICTALERLYILVHTLVNEVKSQQQCPKDAQLSSLVVQFFKDYTSF